MRKGANYDTVLQKGEIDMKRGFFITLEGNDGAGKTTIAKKVVDSLNENGYEAIYTREPGGSAIAEQIRKVLLDSSNSQMDPMCEAMLYAAARRQHLVDVVEPALKEGKIVICDRFIDSSLAYQGVARNLGFENIYALNGYAIQNRMPDRTIFLDIDVETGKQRMGLREDNNRIDREAELFHQAVRKGYDLAIERFPKRIVVVNAERSIEQVMADTMEEITKVIHG